MPLDSSPPDARRIEYKPPRFSAVPWLLDDVDLRPCGAPITTVALGSQVTMGIVVPDAYGKDGSAVLFIQTRNWRDADAKLSIADCHYERPIAKRITKASYYPPQTEGD